MNDLDAMKAMCCLAGLGTDVTLEELQILGRLAGPAGLDKKAMDTLLYKAANDDSLRDELIAPVRRDVDGAMERMIDLAARADSLEEGHIAMLLWRVATKLDIDADRFDRLLAAAGSGGEAG